MLSAKWMFRAYAVRLSPRYGSVAAKYSIAADSSLDTCNTFLYTRRDDKRLISHSHCQVTIILVTLNLHA